MSEAARKICVVTGSRAEYGLLYWLLKDLQADSRVTLQLAVTGMHLSPEFGLTVRQIEADGFTPDARVEMLLSSDSNTGIAKSMGLGIIGFADALERLRPDLLVVLGDRFEVFAAAQAAMVARVPIAHIHGGELTEGLIDEAIRHSVTKMSHFHFVAAEPYRKRVIQLGEAPERVWNVGAPGLDAIVGTAFLDRQALSASIGFNLNRPYFLLTYHPVTLADVRAGGGISALLEALESFPEQGLLITGVNADSGNGAIQDALRVFSGRHPGRAHCCVSLGQQRYLSAMSHAEVVIGNSSSGLIEAPALKVATVNIGDRQRGRIRAASVIDVAEEPLAIAAGIRRALSEPFRAIVREVECPFGSGGASARIASILAEVSLDGVLIKSFRDLA